jgi:integrase
VPGNKRKADKALRDVLTQYEQNHVTIYREDLLFCEYIKIWLEEAKPNLQLITYEAYKSYVDLHIYPFFNKLGVTLQSLNYQHIQKYYASKLKDLSANSLKKHHAVINQTLKKALKHDLIVNNPADEVTLPKAEKFKGSYLSIEQGNALLDVAKDAPIEPAVILGMVYGMRRSEIAGLKWGAIDFNNDTLTIQHTVTKFKQEISRDGTKNKSSNRILPLNRDVKNFLLKLRGQQERDKKILGQAYQNTEYICRWADGRAMRCDYLSRAFKKLLIKHGLPDIRLHDLRHSCASYMLKMGCSMKEVADWLGHADIKTAMNVYAHLDFETKKNVANRFGSILSVSV